MTKAEIDDIFGEFEIDEDYMIKSKDVIGLFVAVKEEPKKEEEAPAPVEAPVEDEDEGDAKKKKKTAKQITLCYLLYCNKKNWLTLWPNYQFSTFQNLLNRFEFVKLFPMPVTRNTTPVLMFACIARRGLRR